MSYNWMDNSSEVWGVSVQLAFDIEFSGNLRHDEALEQALSVIRDALSNDARVIWSEIDEDRTNATAIYDGNVRKRWHAENEKGES